MTRDDPGHGGYSGCDARSRRQEERRAVRRAGPRPGFSIHEMGVARMGAEPRTSVLNQFQQAHDIKNLFVMDRCFGITEHMNREEFLALSEGEALHFPDPHNIPWFNLAAARSFNELVHLLQYRWFRAVIDSSGARGSHLDVACGSGYGTAMLSESPAVVESVGVDLNERHLEYARRHFGRVRFVLGDCEKLDALLPASFFAFVTSGQTIEHLLDPVSFVRSVVRVLRDDGMFLLRTPTHDVGPKLLDDKNPWHICEFDPGYLERLLSFFFSDVRMAGGIPCESVFDDLALAGRRVRRPKANAVFCSRPNKTCSEATISSFRSHYLEDFYRLIIHQVQAAKIEAKRQRHFLRDTYHLINLDEGFYNSEIDKIWTMPQAVMTITPTSPGRSVHLSFSAPPNPKQPTEVNFYWNGGGKRFVFRKPARETLVFKSLSEPLRVRVNVSPPFRPLDHGRQDMRELGIKLVSVSEAS